MFIFGEWVTVIKTADEHENQNGVVIGYDGVHYEVVFELSRSYGYLFDKNSYLEMDLQGA